MTDEAARKAIRRVLILVDGYLSHLPPDSLLGHDRGVMPVFQLRLHIRGALRLTRKGKAK